MELIFAYNAKSGFRNFLIDGAHKILNPVTYSCDLCKLTHGSFGKKKQWKRFVKASQLKMEFYHIDEFEDRFNQTLDYPTVLIRSRNEIEVLINPEKIKAVTNTKELIELIWTMLIRKKANDFKHCEKSMH